MADDYSVTWNQVKALVDVMIENHDEKIAMAYIDKAVRLALDTLFDNMCKDKE